jgi:hypothetical protein
MTVFPFASAVLVFPVAVFPDLFLGAVPRLRIIAANLMS